MTKAPPERGLFNGSGPIPHRQWPDEVNESAARGLLTSA